MSYTYTTPTFHGNITLNPTSVTGSSYNIGIGANGTSATDMWTNTAWSTAPVTITQKATIDLKGEDADIVINGESLNETLQAIKEALRIPSQLSRDPDLEKDWHELQEVADHYTKLFKEYKEKQRVWDTLKSNDK